MQHNIEILKEIVAIDPDCLFTGSFLVDKETANDIDIVTIHHDFINEWLVNSGFTRTNKGYENGGGAVTIKSTWRKGDYNIIVVKDKVAFALWQAFSNIISHTKYQFTNKDDRIELHGLITQGYTPLNDTKSKSDSIEF